MLEIWILHVQQVYLQSGEPLERDVNMSKPEPEFELEPSQCLELFKTLYELCNSGDLWHRTLDSHHIEDVAMQPMRSDPALYANMVDGLLNGLSVVYIGNLIREGDLEFEELIMKTKRRFDMPELQVVVCQFPGFPLFRNNLDGIIQDQNEHLCKLEKLQIFTPFSMFRSMRMRLA